MIFFDGELYNKNELINELELLGHVFINKTDIEVAEHAYTEWQENAVKKFNGIFAFAICEKNSNRVFCARDRIGVKPFFYAVKDGEFIFASKIKTLLQKIPAEIDTQSMAEIILIGPGRTPGYSIFKNISELEPAMSGIFENGKFKKYKYWNLTDGEHTDSFEQTAEKVNYLVIDSIKRQLNSDKICTFLSGGLDL